MSESYFNLTRAAPLSSESLPCSLRLLLLIGLGVVHVRPAPGAQPWVALAIASTFILEGLTMITGYTIAGGASRAGVVDRLTNRNWRQWQFTHADRRANAFALVARFRGVQGTRSIARANTRRFLAREI